MRQAARLYAASAIAAESSIARARERARAYICAARLNRPSSNASCAAVVAARNSRSPEGPWCAMQPESHGTIVAHRSHAGAVSPRTWFMGLSPASNVLGRDSCPARLLRLNIGLDEPIPLCGLHQPLDLPHGFLRLHD